MLGGRPSDGYVLGAGDEDGNVVLMGVGVECIEGGAGDCEGVGRWI